MTSSTPWRDYWECSLTPDGLWQLWLQIIGDCLNILFPLKNVSVREDQPGWFDNEIRRAFSDKIQTYRKACNSRLASDWDSVKEKKKNVRTLIIRKKECMY